MCIVLAPFHSQILTQSARSFDSRLLTHLQHGTGGAMRAFARANVFAKRYKQTVDVNPVFAREHACKGCHRFFPVWKLSHSPSDLSLDGRGYPR